MHHLLPRSLLSFILLTLPCLATAQTTLPNAFTDGTTALASEVNANFDALTSGVNVLEADNAGYTDPQFGYKTIPVDCTSNPNAFLETIQQTAHLDRLKLVLTGTCHSESEDWYFSVGNKDLTITGGYDSESGQCLGSAAIVNPTLPSEESPEEILDINLNNGGVLWLECLTLGDANDVVSVRSFANGYIRIQAGVTTGSGAGYNVLARNNSLFRTFDFQQPSEINELMLLNNSTAEINGAFDIGINSVVAEKGSVFVCRFCSGTMDSVTLKYGSEATFEFTYNTPLTIDSLDASMGSSVFVTLDSDYIQAGVNFTVETLEYDSNVYRDLPPNP